MTLAFFLYCMYYIYMYTHVIIMPATVYILHMRIIIMTIKKDSVDQLKSIPTFL